MPGGRGASPYDGIVTMAPVEGNRNLVAAGLAPLPLAALAEEGGAHVAAVGRVRVSLNAQPRLPPSPLPASRERGEA